jgi:hypothetical protein
MNQNPLPVDHGRQKLMSDHEKHSFSFEQSQGNGNNAEDMNAPNDHNNTATYKYSKMLQDLEVKQSKDKIMRTF